MTSRLIPSIHALADSTGGTYFHNNNDLAGALRHLATGAEPRYVLSYVPASMTGDGKFHSLRVKLLTPAHGAVQARKGYFDPPPPVDPYSGMAVASLDKLMLGDTVASAMPIKVGAHWRRAKNGSQLEVAVKVASDGLPYQKSHGISTESLVFVTALFDLKNKFITGREGRMQLTLDAKTRDRFAKDGFTTLLWLSAPPGEYRMRELVIETNKGRLTSGATGVRIQ